MVYASSYNTFGGVIVSNSSSYGGGIHLWDYCVYNIINGTVYNNFSINDGGGVRLSDYCNYNFIGGNIYDNSSSQGAGITLITHCEYNTNGAKVYNNSGGGMYIRQSSSNVITGIISNNSGNGVYSFICSVITNSSSIVISNVPNDWTGNPPLAP